MHNGMAYRVSGLLQSGDDDAKNSTDNLKRLGRRISEYIPAQGTK